MNPRIPDNPPVILPLTDNKTGPLWSVMVPTYNCISFLRQTLESVLAQDPGPEKMQIEVVDDCSTDGDVHALVLEVGHGRIAYYKQETNKGSLRNFETCLNRARGKWIHLLHGDDKVKIGFYQEIEFLFCQFPEAGAAFTSHTLMDDKGNEYYRTKGSAIISKEPGILSDWLRQIAQRNRLQPPAIVVKRSVYEQVGGFFAVHFGEDWEMWARIAAKYPVAYSPKYLAVYRVHTNNITTRSFLSGQAIKDLNKVINIIQSYLPQEERKELKQLTKKNISRYLIGNAYKVLNQYKKPRAALVQANGALKMYPGGKIIRLTAILYIKCFLSLIKNKKSKGPNFKKGN
jgi:glycosyltransferase involved in cell wall biosynthesis